jgi:hypothetical protein
MRSAYGAVTIPGEREIRIGEHPVTIVVDVANVMGSRPDGWWRDRAGAAVRLHTELVRLAASGRAVPPDEPDGSDPPGFVMVLEGAAKAAAARISRPAESSKASPAEASPAEASPAEVRPAEVRPGEVHPGEVHPGPPRPGEVKVVQARGSGDDAIVDVVRELPGRRVVVTADRELRARCVAAGATILGPGWLLGLLRP